MNDELIPWLRAQLAMDEDALIRYRDGHEGPCLNYEDQHPDSYDEYDSCYRHIATAHACAYRDAEFGLREIVAKRRGIEEHGPKETCPSECKTCTWNDPWEGFFSLNLPCPTLRLLALPFSDRPGYREEWRP